MLRDTPAWQCTRTFVLVMFYAMNKFALLKKHLIFYRALSEINILKCFMLGFMNKLFYPNTETTAPI